MNDTIAAVAASGGPIGIIRVSGAQAIGAVSAVFSPKNGSPLAEAASQKLVYGTLSDKNGICSMPAMRSCSAHRIPTRARTWRKFSAMARLRF